MLKVLLIGRNSFAQKALKRLEAEITVVPSGLIIKDMNITVYDEYDLIIFSPPKKLTDQSFTTWKAILCSANKNEKLSSVTNGTKFLLISSKIVKIKVQNKQAAFYRRQKLILEKIFFNFCKAHKINGIALQCGMFVRILNLRSICIFLLANLLTIFASKNSAYHFTTTKILATAIYTVFTENKSATCHHSIKGRNLCTKPRFLTFLVNKTFVVDHNG